MRRVRLTEGQLHNVIRESVNNLLNEIDWKTYENAFNEKWGRMPRLRYGSEEYSRELDPLFRASDDAQRRKYPHFCAERDRKKGQLSPEEMSPEARKEEAEYEKDIENYLDNKWRYEKGGRGYYVDDDDEE